MRLLGILLCLLPGVAHAKAPADNAVVVEQAWVRATPPGTTVTAGFARIVNKGSQSDKLVGASAKFAKATEIHRTSRKGGTMTMKPAGPVPVAAGKSVTLEPGSLHIMFMKLKNPIKPNQKVQVTLHFERAGQVTVEAVTKQP